MLGRFASFTVTCVAFVVIGTPAEAQRSGGPPSPPIVLSASANVPAGTLTIAGTNFGTAPTVVLAGSPLTPISATNTNIVAALPSLLPQDYQLTVTNPATTLSVNFSLTIEAGDITRVIAGVGLSGGATTGDATLTVDTTQIQKRIIGSCPAGSAIQSIDVGGNVTCEVDDVGATGGFATTGANTFTGTQTIDAGNLDLDPSTATSGNITKNGTRFLHNFGADNTFVGINAGNFTSTGGQNTATGSQALQNVTSGGANTAIGSGALFVNGSGSGNTAVGVAALGNNSAGNHNVALGRLAGVNANTGSNNIYLGANVNGVVGESNAIYLGVQGTQTKTIIAGIRGTTLTGGEMVLVDANGRLGSGPVSTADNTVGSAQVIDDSLTANDLAANSVTSSELANDSVTAAKVAFNYAAGTAEGGAALDIACLGCVAANEVSFSFASGGANTFTATQTIDGGNLDLDPSAASAGNITKNGTLFLHNFGANNTFLGISAGNVTTTGQSNTGVGVGALFNNTTGDGNSAIGLLALVNNTSGSGNTAIGNTALQFNQTGNSNTATGQGALQNNTAGYLNTAIGEFSLTQNTTGRLNTAIGSGALFLNTTGIENVAIGRMAGSNVTTGSNSIYVGAYVVGVAGESNAMYLGNADPAAGNVITKTVIGGIRGTTVTGGEPVVIDATGRLGTGAVAPGTDSVGSTQIIDNSVTASDLASNSVTASKLAADSVTAEKVAFNYAAGTAEGGAALDVACVACVTASEVSFSFASLGSNTFTATQTIDAGNLDLDPSTTTTGNITKNGSRFLSNPGSANTFLGIEAGRLDLTGIVNTAIGRWALMTVTSGSSNTATGSSALQNVTTGFHNTGLGTQALQGVTTGNNNTAVGSGALADSGAMAADSNTAIGVSSLRFNTGHQNTALGRSSLENATTGNNNVAVGYRAGNAATTGSNNIYLGADVSGQAGESNTMYLGSVGTQTKTFIGGVRGITTVNADAIPVMIDSAGQLGTVSSSLRFKEDVTNMADASERLFQLRPVQFRYKLAYGDGSKPVHYGLIAEEVAQVFPELAVRNASGGFDTVHYETLSVLLLNELQKQNAEMDRQRRRIEVLEGQLNQLLQSR